MGVVTSGSVNITVRVDGVGQAPKKVDEASSSLTKLDKAGAQASSSVSTLRDKMGALKSAAAPANTVRETFENLRSNALFLVGAIAGLASGLVALSDAFSENAQAIKAWEEVQKQTAGALTTTEKLIEDIQVKLGKRQPKSDMERLGDSMRDAWSKNQELIDKASAAVAAHDDQVKDLRRLYGDWAPATQKAMKDLDFAQTNLNDLTDAQNLALRESVHLWEEIAKAAGRAFKQDLIDANGQPKVLEWAKGLDRPRSPGGGRGARQPERDWNKLFDEEVERQQRLAARTRGIVETVGTGGAANDNTAKAGFPGLGQGEVRSQGRVAAEGIRDFTAALSESLPIMGSFGAALGEVSQLWGDYADSGKDAARASILSVGAIARAGAEQIKNERLRAGVLSVIELGLGTGLLFVPGRQAEAASHLAAAGILAGVAIFGSGSGSSGGGRSRASGGGSRVTRPLGDTMNGGGWSINIFGGWFGTSHPAETAAALHALSRRGAGSGFVPLPRAA